MTPTEYRSIRKQLGLTQTELAALLHETRDTVSRRERSSKPIHGSAEYALLWLMEHGKHNKADPLNLIEDLLEYAYFLRGCWEWKKGEMAGNAEEYDELCETIDRAKAFVAEQCNSLPFGR